MNRIKFCLLVCTLFGLTACGQEEAVFSLTAAQQEQYSAQIEQITEEYYWDFDGDSLQFSEVKLPENSGAAENLYTASADCTYDMRNYAGSSVGAVFAAFASLDYTYEEFREIFNEVNFDLFSN